MTALYDAALIIVAAIAWWAVLTGYGLPPPVRWEDDDGPIIGDEEDE